MKMHVSPCRAEIYVTKVVIDPWTERAAKSDPGSEQCGKDKRSPRRGPAPFPQRSPTHPGSVHQTVPQADHSERSHEDTSRLKDPAAIITARNAGISGAVAIALAGERADVVLSFLPEEQALSIVIGRSNGANESIPNHRRRARTGLREQSIRFPSQPHLWRESRKDLCSNRPASPLRNIIRSGEDRCLVKSDHLK